MALLLDGLLLVEQRERVEEHVDSCPLCRVVYADSVRVKAALMEADAAVLGRGHSRWRRPEVAAIAAGLVVLFGGVVLTRVALTGGDGRGSAARQQLFAGIGETRPVEPRLTGGLPHAAPPVLRRAATDGLTSDPARWRYLARAEEIRQLAERTASAGNLGDLGAAHLFVGNLDLAVSTLERAVALGPADARLRSDLGAAYLARGVTPNHADDLPAALEAIDAALSRDATLVEARFNRALALQQIGLPRGAATAWQDYLRHHPGDGWAGEARERLDGLQLAPPPRSWQSERQRLLAAAPTDRGPGDQATVDRIVDRYREPARVLVQEEVLPAWGAAVLAQDAAAARRQLAVARALADALTTAGGDGSVSGAVVEAGAASGERLQALAEGHRAFGAASTALEQAAAAAAAEHLRSAAAAFRRAGSQSELWAQLLEVKASFYSGTPPQQLQSALAAMAPRIERSGSAVMRARLSWYTGLIHILQGEVERGLPEYQRAGELLEAAGENDSLLWIRYLQSEAYSLVGDAPAAWQERLAILALLPGVTDRQRSADLLLGAAASALGFEHRPALAAAVLDEMVAADLHTAGAMVAAETLLNRARLRAQRGDRRAAELELAAALPWIRRAPAGFRARALADREAIAGLAAADDDPQQAIDHFSRAIARYEQTGLTDAVPDLLARRAELFQTLGDSGAAEADLEKAMAALEGSAAEADFRSRIDASHAPFQLASRLLAARGDTDGAFLAAERGRARALLGLVSQGQGNGPVGGGAPQPTRPLGLRDVQRRLPAGVRLLTYAVLPDRVLMWGVSRGEARFRTVALDAIATDATTLRADLQAGAWTAQSRDRAARLFERLVLPLLPPGAGEETIVVVPDGPLHQVPFAALVDRQGRFLVESRAVVVAPSATLYLQAERRAAGKAHAAAATTALVFGDPAFDQRIHPHLQRLPGAVEEATRVAALYGTSDLRLGVHASRDAFLRAASASSVIHVAGHAVLNRSTPSHSSLALAPSGQGREGTLFAYQIAGMRLSRTRVVFLAACESGTGAIADGEGSLSLARAFLAADVPTVVASLWPVDDRGTRELLVRAHQSLARGVAPAAALRNAQLLLLRGRDPALRSPASWAAFQALGT